MKATFFRSPDAFASSGVYSLLPFRFMRWPGDEVLVTNDGGEWIFLPTADFKAFSERRLPRESAHYRPLRAKHFLCEDASLVPVELLATKFRSKKAFLEGFTSLHMFVVTLRCDHSCPYCQVSRVTEDRLSYDMTKDMAMRAVDFMFRSPSPQLKVEFQGGEALLHFEAVRWIVEAVNERNKTQGRDIQFVIATNLSHLSDDVIAFCREHQVHLSTSLDGPEWLHNANRPRPGRDSYERLVASLNRARAALGHDRVSALMTTTADSLRHPTEIVDEYVALGFDGLFLRSISPYGFAVRSKVALRYETDAFVGFYQTALERIIEWNRKGTRIVEFFAQILLRKILTPFPTGYVDLQSPAGAGIGALVFNYDGDIYASDEGRMLAEMNDHNFRLGNLARDTYREVMGGARLRAIVEQSVAETLPGCSDCAFVPFCGADPTFHWATQGDAVGHRATSAFCRKNMAIIRHLMDLLRHGDDFTRTLLTSWAV
jgi:His-Xaa-Ser system radical SAM maturase HxsB